MDVKKFLDPTVMNGVLEYRFQAIFFPGGTRLYSHRPYIGGSLNYWSAAWAEVPIRGFSVPGAVAGRALTRRLMVTGGYAHYVAGKRTFNQVLVVGLRFIWEKEKVKPEVSSTLKSASHGFPSGSS